MSSMSLLGTVTPEQLDLPFPKHWWADCSCSNPLSVANSGCKLCSLLFLRGAMQGTREKPSQDSRHLGHLEPFWKLPCSQSCQPLSNPSSPDSPEG